MTSEVKLIASTFLKTSLLKLKTEARRISCLVKSRLHPLRVISISFLSFTSPRTNSAQEKTLKSSRPSRTWWWTENLQRPKWQMSRSITSRTLSTSSRRLVNLSIAWAGVSQHILWNRISLTWWAYPLMRWNGGGPAWGLPTLIKTNLNIQWSRLQKLSLSALIEAGVGARRIQSLTSLKRSKMPAITPQADTG